MPGREPFLNKIISIKSIFTKKQLRLLSVAVFAILLLFLTGLTARECFLQSLSTSVTSSGDITVTLPNGFIAEKDNISEDGENLSLYNISGTTNKVALSGFIREAILTEPLGEYLKKSEEYKSASIYDFSQKNISASGVSGYVWSYSVSHEDGSKTFVRSAFFPGINKFYTLHLAANSQKKDSVQSDVEMTLDTVFNSIIQNLKFSDSVQSGKLFEWYNAHNRVFSHCKQLFRGAQADDKSVRFFQQGATLSNPFQF